MTTDKNLRYGLAVAAGAALALWVGLPPALLLFLLVCPLMMLFMMRSMGGMGGGEDHTGLGSEHDPTRQDHPAEPRS